MNTCRFCKEYGDNLVKYEVRHYAHAKCILKAKGAATFEYFSLWQLNSQFPVIPVIEAGLHKEMRRKIAQLTREERARKRDLAKVQA